LDELNRCRRALKNGITNGRRYPPLAWSPEATSFLFALAGYRLAAKLTQPELAKRAGLPRETVARLERLKRRAKPEIAQALASALGVTLRALAGAD
jgi:DNA-binding XRE family transcriptional regulator